MTGIALAEETQGNLPAAPKTLNEAGTFVTNLLKPLPGALENAWKDALRIWKNLWERVRPMWGEIIQQKLDYLWQKIQNLIKKEIENRKPIIQKGFEEEKQEITQEAKTEGLKFGKDLWNQFKDLINIK